MKETHNIEKLTKDMKRQLQIKKSKCLKIYRKMLHFIGDQENTS